MKYFVFFLLMICGSCSQALDEPKNLLTIEKMSEIIADFALADQMNYLTSGGSIETETRYILKKHKIKGADFKESYTYYTGTNKLDLIFDKAQELVIETDPKAAGFIEKKLKENSGLAPLER